VHGVAGDITVLFQTADLGQAVFTSNNAEVGNVGTAMAKFIISNSLGELNLILQNAISFKVTFFKILLEMNKSKKYTR